MRNHNCMHLNIAYEYVNSDNKYNKYRVIKYLKNYSFKKLG